MDVPFTLQYLYQYFSPNTTTLAQGNIIIGNDFTSAAIFLDSGYFIIPVSGQTIKVYDIYFLNSFFPNGYIIKAVPIMDWTKNMSTAMNLRTAYLNNTAFCILSNAFLAYSYTTPLFDLNNHWLFRFQCKDSGIDIQLMGYINQFYSIFQKGTVTIVYYFASLLEYFDIQIVPSDYFAQINFQNEGTYIALSINATINVYGNRQNLLLTADSNVASDILLE